MYIISFGSVSFTSLFAKVPQGSPAPLRHWPVSSGPTSDRNRRGSVSRPLTAWGPPGGQP
ncbi:uncharacterized protein QC761_0003030 [Podospora bellae-mahoneyi]|uniref:Uncharacterized protein n=1 Tax=Podospora bellae-mahoneyi TaxID=2093777 RepID=A0ABR0FUK7_9PEZI|nr:hypothetical protein QC761_0003030 [Podospora bellae-mahoneyi]